jgi:hypothetical protein
MTGLSSINMSRLSQYIIGKTRKRCGIKKNMGLCNLGFIVRMRTVIYVMVSFVFTVLLCFTNNPFYDDGRRIYRNIMMNNRPTLYEAYHDMNRCTPSVPCMYDLERYYMDGGAFLLLMYNSRGHMFTFGNLTKLNGYNFQLSTNSTRIDYSNQNPYTVITGSINSVLKTFKKCEFEIETISYYNPSPLDCSNFMNSVLFVISKASKTFPITDDVTIKIYRLSEYYRHAVIYRVDDRLVAASVGPDLEKTIDMHMSRVRFNIDYLGFIYVWCIFIIVVIIVCEITYFLGYYFRKF